VAFEFHDLRFHVRVPHKDLKIKPTTHNNLVFLGVGHLSDGLLMTFEQFNGLLSEIFNQILAELLPKVLLQQLLLMRFLFLMLNNAALIITLVLWGAAFFLLIRFDSTSPQIPQHDVFIVGARR